MGIVGHVRGQRRGVRLVNKRLLYLKNMYDASLIDARINAMEHDSCIMREKEEGMENLDAYCRAFIWRGDKTCAERVQYLQDDYITNLTAAKIDVIMDESCISVE